MPKLNCNIIKDLMPSYMDNLCSDESRAMVDEHFVECEDCKKIYEQSLLELLHTNAISTKDIDYLKKIKKGVLQRNAIVLTIIGILYFMELYINFTSLSSNLFNYFIFTPLTCGLLFFILPDFAENKVPTKKKYTLLGIEVAVMIVSFLLLFGCGWMMKHYRIPFGMRPEQIGPFLSGILYIALLGFVIIFPVTLYFSLKKKMVCPALCFLPVSAISLLFEYQHYLHEFSDTFYAMDYATMHILFGIETLGMLGLYMWLNRKK